MNLPRLTTLLSALSQSTRAKVYFTIYESPEPLHSAQVAGILKIKEPLASHHLGILTRTGLLTRLEVGKFALFFVDQDVLGELVEFFTSLRKDQDANDFTGSSLKNTP